MVVVTRDMGQLMVKSCKHPSVSRIEMTPSNINPIKFHAPGNVTNVEKSKGCGKSNKQEIRAVINNK